MEQQTSESDSESELDSEEDDGKEAVSKRPRRSHPSEEVLKINMIMRKFLLLQHFGVGPLAYNLFHSLY